MAGASIEATLELWASSLRDVKERMRPLFTQERVAASAGAFLDGLLGNERRKTGWMRAETAGDPGPWRQQAILGRGRWEANDLRDIVRGYALDTLADDDAVLVFDETGFLKQGKASCGVARQYTGSAGKITNCQIGVFACYVSRHGHAFIDRASNGSSPRSPASASGAVSSRASQSWRLPSMTTSPSTMPIPNPLSGQKWQTSSLRKMSVLAPRSKPSKSGTKHKSEH